MNRIGIWFPHSVFWMISQFGSTTFTDVFAKASTGPTVTIITLLLFVGATGKSAQIPSTPGCPMPWLVLLLFLH
jgi:NADH-quinone oxidoreductase subunit L